MRHRIVWFLLGVLLGSVLFVLEFPPKVFVDAWTVVDDDAWGTKWVGLPTC